MNILSSHPHLSPRPTHGTLVSGEEVNSALSREEAGSLGPLMAWFPFLHRSWEYLECFTVGPYDRPSS